MFLFFSKVIAFLITPANWLIALLIWLCITSSKSVRKKLSISILLLIVLFGNEFVFNQLVNAWQPLPVELTKKADAGILLGGLGSFDKNGNGYLNNASDRLIAICTIYKQGNIKKIIISAGNIDKSKPSEADYLSKRLVQLGVSENDIIAESTSRSTYENAVFTKKILDSIHLKPPYVLVTSALHIPRSVAAFKKAGIDVIPYPSNYTVIDKKFSIEDYIIPKLYIINDWYFFAKEVVGMVGYKLFEKA